MVRSASGLIALAEHTGPALSRGHPLTTPETDLRQLPPSPQILVGAEGKLFRRVGQCTNRVRRNRDRLPAVGPRHLRG